MGKRSKREYIHKRQSLWLCVLNLPSSVYLLYICSYIHFLENLILVYLCATVLFFRHQLRDLHADSFPTCWYWRSNKNNYACICGSIGPLFIIFGEMYLLEPSSRYLLVNWSSLNSHQWWISVHFSSCLQACMASFSPACVYPSPMAICFTVLLLID